MFSRKTVENIGLLTGWATQACDRTLSLVLNSLPRFVFFKLELLLHLFVYLVCTCKGTQCAPGGQRWKSVLLSLNGSLGLDSGFHAWQ